MLWINNLPFTFYQYGPVYIRLWMYPSLVNIYDIIYNDIHCTLTLMIPMIIIKVTRPMRLSIPHFAQIYCACLFGNIWKLIWFTYIYLNIHWSGLVKEAIEIAVSRIHYSCTDSCVTSGCMSWLQWWCWNRNISEKLGQLHGFWCRGSSDFQGKNNHDIERVY